MDYKSDLYTSQQQIIPKSTKCELSCTSIFDADITIVQQYKDNTDEDEEYI